MALIGIGGRYGGMRPVDHLSQIFAYRNAYVYPQRVFLFNIWDQLKAESLAPETLQLSLIHISEPTRPY